MYNKLYKAIHKKLAELPWRSMLYFDSNELDREITSYFFLSWEDAHELHYVRPFLTKRDCAQLTQFYTCAIPLHTHIARIWRGSKKCCKDTASYKIAINKIILQLLVNHNLQSISDITDILRKIEPIRYLEGKHIRTFLEDQFDIDWKTSPTARTVFGLYKAGQDFQVDAEL